MRERKKERKERSFVEETAQGLGTLIGCVEWGLTICDKISEEIQPRLLKVHNLKRIKYPKWNYTKNSKYQPGICATKIILTNPKHHFVL